jgi:hypothetical protein
MMRGPLIGAVQDFSVDIVLMLRGGRVAPPNRSGTSVPLQFAVLPLIRRHPPIKVIHHSRRTVSLHRIQHPAEKSGRFVREADTMEGVDGEGRIPHPGIPVVPVA